MDETAAGGGILSGIGWVLQNIAMSFYNLGYAITHPASWLDWSDQTAIMRFIYYGASVELWFIVVTFFLVLFAIGLWKRSFLWGLVIGLEFFGNWVGRFFAWAGLLMVLSAIRSGPRARLMGDADRSLAQVDDDAALLLAHRLHDVVQRRPASEDIGDDVLGVETDRHVLAVADVAKDDGQMMHAVPGQHVGEGLGLAARRVDV